MTWPLAIAALVVCAATVLQSATGFGFALVAGPALFAVTEPTAAVGLILLLGTISAPLILFTEGRAPAIDRRAACTAVAFALPGLPLGALAVHLVPRREMTLVVALVVVGLVAHRLRGRADPLSPPGPGSAALAGFATGVLTTSTTTNGPPLAMWLTGRGLRPDHVRDTVTAIFLALDLVGLGVLAAVSGGGAAFEAAHWLPVLAPIVVIGQRVGSRAFRRLSPRRYEQAVLIAAVAAATAGVVSAFA